MEGCNAGRAGTSYGDARHQQQTVFKTYLWERKALRFNDGSSGNRALTSCVGMDNEDGQLPSKLNQKCS